MALTGLTKVQKIGINSTTIPTFGGSRNTGVVTATTFIGDGSGLSNVTGSGSGVIVRDGGSLVGTAGTINFGTNLNVSAISAGIVTVTNAASATALTNLSDVTISSPSNGQVLKYNGSAFVNAADTNTTYSQSSVASGSNVNLRLSDGSTDDDILITAGSNITFSSVSANGFTIASSGGGGGGGLSNVVEDTSPELGGNLNLNNKFITGSGGINVSGVTTSTSFVGNITGNVTGNADTATNSTNSSHVLVTDNESTDENNLIAFIENAVSNTGNVGLEMDGNLTYNPSSGNLTATKFTGSGVALTGVVTSIVAGANITLTGGPTGIVTIASSGGGGGVSLANGVDNRVVTATGAAALNGETNLTWNGTTLAVVGNQTISTNLVVGSATTISGDGINVTGVSTLSGNCSFAGNNVTMTASGSPNSLNVSGTSRFEIASMENAVLDGEIAHTGDTTTLIKFETSTIKLDTAGTTRLNINNSGANITGVCTATSFSGLNGTGIVVSGVSTFHNNIIGTATTAISITAADESSDTSCNVLFATAATGNVAPKTGTNLTFNSNTGALTAGSFVKSGGSSSQFLKADGSVDGSTYLTSGSYLENVSEDSSPQLGGNLDLNSNDITGTGNAQIVGVITATSAVPTWTLGASGTDHYTFIGNGFTSATNDPDIYLVRGQRYAFLNNSGGNHPFQIQSDANSTAYNTGVTNNNATSGYITFNVPMSAPAHLYYKCSNHPNMLGNIYIVGQHLANGGNDRIITATSAYGMNAESDLQFDGTNLFMPSELRHLGDPDTKIGFDNNAIRVETAGSERFRFASDGVIHVASPDSASGGRIWANSSALYLQSGNGRQTLKVSDASAGVNRTIEMTSAGNLAFPSGNGIDFSASAGPTYGTTTQDSELLDDYEEGKITFESINSGFTIDTSFKGRYTKVGELVTVSGYIVASSWTSSSNQVRVKMPFTSAANSEGYYTRGVGATFSRNMNFPTNYHNMVAYIGGGENYMRFFMTRNAGGSADWHQMVHSNLSSTAAIYFNVCYTTTS